MSRIGPAAPIDDRLLIAIAGPQACGKTTSALRLATGVVRETGGKILMVDSENKRGLRYAKDFKFDHLPLDPPFGPDRYCGAFEEAEQAGYGQQGNVIIFDSMSHEHEGIGGVLELSEKWLDDKAGSDWGKREKIKFLSWNYAKKERKTFISHYLQRTQAHVILCFRAKEKLGFVKDGQGKEKPVNNGWQPIGGEEYFFEMNIAMILPEGAQGKPDWKEKASRINEYGDGPLKKLLYGTQQISEETGAGIKRICSAGAPATQPVASPAATADPMKELAGKINAAIKSAPSTEALYDLFNVDYKDDLAKIKAASQTAYDFLAKAYDTKYDQLKSEAA